MLSLNQLSKEYMTPQGALKLLSNVSLSLDKGEAVTIMGPSGSGKSTLLFILGTLETPTAGEVLINGCNPFHLSQNKLAQFRNRHIGFLFQDHCLLPQCSVLENVLSPTLMTKSTDKYKKRALSLLEQVGLKERIEHFPSELSGGEKQRVALARAMIRRPSLLLCDEPTGNLDRQSASLVADLLKEQHQNYGSTLIVVTHSSELASRFSSRYQLINQQLQQIN